MFPSYNQVLSLAQSALDWHTPLKFPGLLCDYHYYYNLHSGINKSLPVQVLKEGAQDTGASQVVPRMLSPFTLP